MPVLESGDQTGDETVVELTDGGAGNRFGTSIIATGDLNSNGYVDFDDLTVQLANWDTMGTVGEGNVVDPDEVDPNDAH